MCAIINETVKKLTNWLISAPTFDTTRRAATLIPPHWWGLLRLRWRKSCRTIFEPVIHFSGSHL